MSRYRRAAQPGATFFFTVVTYRRQPILCDEVMRNALREAIRRTRAKQPFTINAWVLMPDHLHCIWTLPEEDADFSARWMTIKRTVSVLCREHYRHLELRTASQEKHRESTIWQRRFWEHRSRDERDFERHADYLHFNPVKHGYASSVADWPYSTFHRYVKEGLYPADWSGTAESTMVDSD